MRSIRTPLVAAVLAVTLAAVACAPNEELAAPSDLVATVDGHEVSLAAEAGGPRLLWFWGPF